MLLLLLFVLVRLMGFWVLLFLPVLTLLIHLLNVEVFSWPNLPSWVVLLLCGVIGTAVADFCWGEATRSTLGGPTDWLAAFSGLANRWSQHG